MITGVLLSFSWSKTIGASSTLTKTRFKPYLFFIDNACKISTALLVSKTNGIPSLTTLPNATISCA